MRVLLRGRECKGYGYPRVRIIGTLPVQPAAGGVPPLGGRGLFNPNIAFASSSPSPAKVVPLAVFLSLASFGAVDPVITGRFMGFSLDLRIAQASKLRDLNGDGCDF